jgi:hypothetical protein
MKKNFPSERGQAMILIVLAIVGLIGITALAVDGGMFYADRRRAQNAADSAVLAASLARLRGDNYVAAALARAQQNGYENDGVKSSIEVNVPPISGPNEGNSEYIQVLITSHYDTFFGSVVGANELTNNVEAVARAKPPEFGPIMNGYALASLAPASDCNHEKSFWAHGEATLRLYGGGVFINSNNPTCAFLQEGSASLVFVDNESFNFNIVGGASIQKVQLIKRIVSQPASTTSKEITPGRQATISFLPGTGSSPISYPPPFVMPKPRCGSKIAEIDLLDPTVMGPGNWGEDFPPEGVTKLKPGIYCINGNVRIDKGKELTGHGVLLVVEHGSVHFSSYANVSLEAPNSGPFKGLLIFLPMDNNSLVVLTSSDESVFRGTILAPASKIRILGNESRYGYHSQIIGYTIELDGNSDISINYVAEQNYNTLTNPEIQFGQ